MVVKRLPVSRKHFLGHPGRDLCRSRHRTPLICTTTGRHARDAVRTDLIRRTACEMTLKGNLEQVLP